MNVVIPPLDKRRLINRVIERVIRHGADFEALLLAREIRNPDYAFLFDPKVPRIITFNVDEMLIYEVTGTCVLPLEALQLASR